jgi:hypothetical protein
MRNDGGSDDYEGLVSRHIQAPFYRGIYTSHIPSMHGIISKKNEEWKRSAFLRGDTSLKVGDAQEESGHSLISTV